jgi:methyltransferase (TIGR00027 family)
VTLYLAVPKALCDAGFEPEKPTGWSAEGLMPYLSAAGQDLLFEQIHALSVSGSRIAVDVVTAAFYEPENAARFKAFYDELRDAVIEGGDDMPDYPGLWYEEERTGVVDWLQQHGWNADAVDVHDVMASFQRAVPKRGRTQYSALRFHYRAALYVTKGSTI